MPAHNERDHHLQHLEDELFIGHTLFYCEYEGIQSLLNPHKSGKCDPALRYQITDAGCTHENASLGIILRIPTMKEEAGMSRDPRNLKGFKGYSIS
jgi:hypothetical protein